MADRRSARARSGAGAPYDLNRPENWTVEKLREELRKNNVSFRQSDKKSVLLKKVKDLTLSRSRVEHEDRPVELASGSSNGNAYQDSGDHRQLMQTILTLTETVSKLQDILRMVKYTAIKQRVLMQWIRDGRSHGNSRGPKTIITMASLYNPLYGIQAKVSRKDFLTIQDVIFSEDE
uniref:Uncharacterized protein n=1 Tax=Magallana gigas TaxID=29159 RepID=K1QF26_MAGGI